MAEAQDPAPWRRQRGASLLPQAHFSCYASAGRRRLQTPLHNFSFPSMSWGSQRLLRCVKLEPLGGSRSPGPGSASEGDEPRKRRRIGAPPSPAAAGVGDAVEGEDVKDEPLVKFRDVMEVAIQRTSLPSPLGAAAADFEGVKEPSGLPPLASVAEVSRPWNLRLRRAACSAPGAAMEDGLHKAPNKPNHVALAEERPKFSSVLSTDEIAEDFFVMTGSKPPRRPKKRPRKVQRKIEILYPGFYLCEVTPELY